MPFPRLAAFFTGLIGLTLLSGNVCAQSAIVSKIRSNLQIDAGTSIPREIAGFPPYSFDVAINGSVPLAGTATLTLPDNRGTLTLMRSASGGWVYSDAFSSSAALDALYPNGNYTLQFAGRSVVVPLTGDLYPAVPLITTSNGSWINGVLSIEPKEPVTFTVTNPNGASGLTAFVLSLSGGSLSRSVSNGSNPNLTQLSLTFPANTFQPGATYGIAALLGRIVNLDTTSFPGYVIAGSYVVSNSITIVTGPPVFTRHPESHAVERRSTIVLTAETGGVSTYHWEYNGARISTASFEPTLVLSGDSLLAGTYRCVATNTLGSTTSNPAELRIIDKVEPSRLINLSILTNAGSGTRALTLGAVIGGKTDALPVVVRAVGPSLATLFGVSDVLGDPVMSVNPAGVAAPIAINDDWSGAAHLATAFTAVGAFALPPTSQDSAFVSTGLAPGNYTVQVAGKDNAAGQVLAEVYDASGATRSETTARLINLSTLTNIAANDTLSVGFVLSGTTSRTVLIRAVGPTLGAIFGLGGTMSDPKLTLFDTVRNREVGSNDDWDGGVQLASEMRQAGAFALASPFSQDAVLLVTLPPSNYSVRVNGNNASGGTVLVEVYEVP
jgi:hypothetical protein